MAQQKAKSKSEVTHCLYCCGWTQNLRMPDVRCFLATTLTISSNEYSSNIFHSFLADSTVCSRISSWHQNLICNSVCRLSGRQSVCNAVHCGAKVGEEVKSRAVMFLAGNFLFTSSDTFAVGCIV